MHARASVSLACFVLGALILVGALGQQSALAQGDLVEKVARVEVPIYDDNLDDAKSRAIFQGQANALRSLIDDLVATEWVTLFDKELRRRILNRVSRYVSSYRVQKLEPSIDRTRYLVVLSAQINRLQLAEDLREISLPVRGDQPTTVALYYAHSDPVLGQPALRAIVEDKLKARLGLLNYRAGSFMPVRADAADALSNPLGAFPERLRLLAQSSAATGLFVAFGPAPPGAQPADVGARFNAWLYQKSTAELLGTFEQQERTQALRLAGRTARERELIVSKLVDPLVIQIQPGAIQSVRTAAGGDAELRLRVLGLRSVEEQELFERAFFRRNTPFERFSLFALAPEAVTYHGPYGGDRTALERELREETIGDFRVRQVYWYNDVLELDVQRQSQPVHAEMRLFPPEVRSLDVASALEDYLARFNNLEVEDPLYAEVEDNGWLSRANSIPFNATIYAFADSRSDSDVYVGEALNGGETVTLIWHRIGRTNLTPAIRIYDEDGVLVQTFAPRSWLRHEYKLPKGQHRFYVEVGDRFGYLKVDTGGYLHFHYLFKVQRTGP